MQEVWSVVYLNFLHIITFYSCNVSNYLSLFVSFSLSHCHSSDVTVTAGRFPVLHVSEAAALSLMCLQTSPRRCTLPVAALLVVCLREEPEDLNSWRHSTHGDSCAVRVHTASQAGTGAPARAFKGCWSEKQKGTHFQRLPTAQWRGIKGAEAGRRPALPRFTATAQGAQMQAGTDACWINAAADSACSV